MSGQEEIRQIAADIRAKMDTIENTEGWERLSPTQQKLIRASLIVNERAKRGAREEALLDSDPIIRTLAWFARRGVLPDLADSLRSKRIASLYRHRPSKEHVDDYHCNAAVYVLENIDRFRNDRRLYGNVPRELPNEDFRPQEDFFSGIRYDFSDSDQIAQAFNGQFPYVCHVSGKGAPDARESSTHSFVVLGRQGSDFVVWEKVERRESYRCSTLTDIRETYNPSDFDFFVRPFRRTEQSI